ncbi:MAG: [FeFe] hydrogenase H-cluster radical SAM maturase HydG, partial [Chitinivibrionales bacterium]
AKAESIESLSPEETACLLHVEDPDLVTEMELAAGRIKKKVYDNRIVTFAPLYLSNLCVNNCLYCGLRCENSNMSRDLIDMESLRREVEVLAGRIGHKRLIVVYGEHPKSDIDFMEETIRTIYDVKVRTKKGFGQIRRVNVNAAPLSVENLRRLHEVGIGTYQVFQETYHKPTYAKVHPKGTLKSDYRWRLYCMHRALEAGIDDVGVGALFGLYDWRYEIMGLVHHALELERATGIGPHTVSFPRLEPADNAPIAQQAQYAVDDKDFRKAITVIRLAIPYTGMILTAREDAQMRRDLLPLGITQTDASTRIGIGAYSDAEMTCQAGNKQQFMLGDTRSLDEVIRELAQMGYITSFCTAGYRCGRTGECIMDLLRSGQEGKFCKLNAVLTFREWLDDFASEETKTISEPVVQHEIEEVREKMPKIFDSFFKHYLRTVDGERDLYF